ncbi:MAG: VOC family protein [Actinobacteria bacterium]|nr:VOC family protein [Actinomycetota bacterium]
MSQVETKLKLTQVGRVVVQVTDRERALDFYVGMLGLEKVVDVSMGPGAWWIEVAVAGAPTTIALTPPRPPADVAEGVETGIILDTTDVEADHAALKAAGADVDAEITRYGAPVPPMFWVRDPDGNSLTVVQPNR